MSIEEAHNLSLDVILCFFVWFNIKLSADFHSQLNMWLGTAIGIITIFKFSREFYIWVKKKKAHKKR